MFVFRVRINLKEICVLFTSGLLIGVTVNILSKTCESKTIVAPFKKEILNATTLFDRVKICCLVLTTKSNHEKKAIHVKNTWGSRCNRLVFASNITDLEIGSVNMMENDDYELLWGKTKNSMIYAYENLYNDFDWFLKADDDTYAILDNMRYLLSAYSTNDPIYFGKNFNFFLPAREFEYFLGGPGYVLSREALKRFVTQAIPHKEMCQQRDRACEDLEIGKCMHNVGVYHGDARDRSYRERFLPFSPDAHLFPKFSEWYKRRVHYRLDGGLDCCSNTTISFHAITPYRMYLLEYFIFNLKVYGVHHRYEPMPQKKEFTDVVQTLLTEAVENKRYILDSDDSE